MSKHFVSNKDESVRMFNSNFSEFFSKVHFTVPMIIFLPVIIYLFYRTFFELSYNFFPALGIFVIGFAVWTFTEYTLHRFVFHYIPSSNWGKKIHFILHGVHHDYPNDSMRLVMPPIVSIPMAILCYLLFKMVLSQFYIAPMFAGFVAGYLCYDIGHYAIHHFKMKGKFLTAIKNHHMKHHYQNSESGYGVSSPLWDFIFKTNFLPKDKNKVKH